jgi:hypothetical protein
VAKIIAVEVPARVETPGQAPAMVPVTLVWTDEDPWAVTIDFGEFDWVLARQLLADGLTSACGDGDVRFRPGAKGEVVMTLYGSDPGDIQSADLHLPTSQAWGFLGQTFDITPPGLESIPDSEYDYLLEDV